MKLERFEVGCNFFNAGHLEMTCNLAESFPWRVNLDRA